MVSLPVRSSVPVLSTVMMPEVFVTRSLLSVSVPATSSVPVLVKLLVPLVKAVPPLSFSISLPVPVTLIRPPLLLS